ncbi:Rne/Rng family ribonuclease [Vulgatibacter incomptus]|uniref:Ribonuclease G n=1 Tax=Vulgatibacter incomptus TaxID=1391653 RepID=A0A0K1P8X8_9BACT|nr:Rne/Rng family ribonuclease [Vulgatibacter incomptus]AKU89962.1 Cytoplasmic axial filament protein CafA and Ribonuclease G [Vulgatibacter incomptus]
MSSSLVINATGSESRVALVENGQISEFYLERNADKGIVGNIYKGRVVRVLPGMQAAFVDIGLDKAAFLYVSDVYYDPDFSERQFELTEGEHPESEGVPDEYAAAMLARGEEEGEEEGDGEAKEATAAEGKKEEARKAKAAPHKEKKEKPHKEVNIQDLLKEGQEVIVQVAKDPIGTKGARITSHISIPGRHLVFMPTVDHVGISRRIENEKERRRLRETVDALRPPGTGFIVRTVADGVPAEKLQADARFLIHIWTEIGRKKDKTGAPALLHPDLDIVLRATRDLFSADVEKLVIDDRAEYERIMRFVQATDPALASHVEHYQESEPIFDAYGIEHELQRAQQRKVWLKSGGYLIIDQAEALTAIDVNSGRYVGKQSLEETITKINIEAAKEVVYQLRLRNIGGIIIIDFIDMDKSQNRDKVFKALQEALGRDKAKTNVLKISELGLVEMTRKRVRESIGRMLTEPCPYCEGRGAVKSRITVAHEIFRELRREVSAFREPTIAINCHPEVARTIQGEERDTLRFMMDKYNKTIQVKAQQHYHLEQFDLYGRQEKKEAKAAQQQAQPRREEKKEEKREEKKEEKRGERREGRGGERQARGGGQRGEGRGGEGRGGEGRGGEGRGGEGRGGERRAAEGRAGEARDAEDRASEPRAAEVRAEPPSADEPKAATAASSRVPEPVESGSGEA